MVEAIEGAADDAEDDPRHTVLHLFTGPSVTVDGRRFAVPEGSKRLLGYVALHRRRIDRRQVAGALWPDGGDDRAAGNLRSALWRLRCADIDVLDADKWTLGLHDGVAVDVRDVHAWAGRLISGTPDAEDLAVRPSWVDALDLLPGWCEDWVLYERERLRQRTLHALESSSRRLTEAGRAADAVDAALLAVAAEPLRESAQRALIEAHIAEGNRAEALRTYETYRRLLWGELGVDPSPALLAPLRMAAQEHSRPPVTMGANPSEIPLADRRLLSVNSQ